MFNFLKAHTPIVLKKDIHAHLLPGIDDGPKTMEESIAMILLLKEMGYEQLTATPHVYSDYYPNTKEKILETFADLQEELQKQEIDISITPSAEYYLEEEFENILTSNSLLPLFDKHILVETSTLYTDPKFKEYLFNIRMHGYIPIVAHPERYLYFKEEDYASFLNLSCKFQINILSLTGHYGPDVKARAKFLIKKFPISYVGTDAHRIGHLKKIQTYLASSNARKLLSVLAT